MAVVLAYTTPALGHLFPFCALLNELTARGHTVHIRTLASGVALCNQLGMDAAPVDPRIEALQSDDWTTGNSLRVVARTVRMLTARARIEVVDIAGALAAVKPDVVLVDANCWGAISAMETQRRPWLVFSPFVPYLDSPGSPPFGAGMAPMAGPVGRIRDRGVSLVTRFVFDQPFRDGMAPVRAALSLPPVSCAAQLLRRAPRLLVTTGKPFEYPHTDWGPSVHLIGPAVFDPPGPERPSWLNDIEGPIVLVTTSSVPQADGALLGTAIRALRDLPVHVVATCPAGSALARRSYRRVTVAEFVPHSMVLDRAVCVITHGGLGITQKALNRAIPVCAVPFGRDQFEVARRVEIAGCGTRLTARRLSATRLRRKVTAAMTMTDGASAVAAGFAATGGVHFGADIVEGELA
ncbi:MAG: glycosyltransferase [Mycobacterium sp.]